MREGWRQLSLADVAEVNPSEPPLAPDAPFVPMDAVEPGARWPAYFTETLGRGGTRARGGDVLYARITPCLENGKVAQVPTHVDRCGGSTEFIVLRARPGLERSFLYLWATSSSVRARATALMTGSTGRQRLAASDVAVMPFALPPLDEQRRIVDLIRSLDDVRLANDDVAERAFGVLGADQGRLLAELSQAPTVPLAAIADVVGGITKDAKRESNPTLITVPYLRVANVQLGWLDLSEITEIRVSPAKLSALRLQPGDILFNEGGDRDKLGRGSVWEGQIDPCIHQNHVLRARLTTPDFDPWFISLWGNGPFGRRWFEENGAQTTNLASVSIGTLRRFPVPVIPLDRQRSIAQLHRDARHYADAARRTAVSAAGLRSRLVDVLLSGADALPASYDRFLEATP